MQHGLRSRIGVLALALALPLAACDDITDDGGNGRVNVVLTDAAGDIESAVVTISSIYFQGGGSDSVDSRVFLVGDADTDAGVEVNLTDLQNTISQLATGVSVPAGTYRNLRIALTGACIVVEGENDSERVYATSGYSACGAASGNLQPASILQRGIQIILPSGGFVVGEGETTTMLVDFDVSQSFGRQAGNSDNWVVHPVVKATRAAVAGAITVNATLAQGLTLPAGVTLEGFSVRLTDQATGGTEDLALSSTGTATFNYLFPGSYSVALVAPAGFSVTTTPATETLTVTSGATVTSGLSITAVAPLP